MSTPTKSLWLLAPPAIVLVAWAATRTSRGADSVPTPNSEFVLVATSILGALLLSIAGFVLGSRSRHPNPAVPGRSRTTTLRVVQSLRISTRDWVHAVEFESTTFLIGASDGNMVLLDSIRESADEHPLPAHSSDGGVDLRDTPRPDRDPTPTPRTLASAGVARTALTAANLADFKARLDRARTSQV